MSYIWPNLPTSYDNKDFESDFRSVWSDYQTNLSDLGKRVDGYYVDYVWADEAARNAQSGMLENEHGLQLTNGGVYRYISSNWVLQFYQMPSDPHITGDLTIGGTVDGVDIAGHDIPDLAVGNIHIPLTELDLQNKLNLIRGVGSVTFTRSTVKNYIDRYGVVQQAAIDTPAFEKEGCLLEGASTNLLTRSEEFDHADWVKSNCTITPNDTNAPDETATADKVVESNDAGSPVEHRASQVDVTPDAAGTFTYSIFAKKAERTKVRLLIWNVTDSSIAGGYFNLDTGTITNITGSATITELDDDWYRCTVTGTQTEESQCIFYLVDAAGNSTYDGDGSSGAYFWGAQCEELPFASSYIITEASTVTRTVDVMTIERPENKPGSLDDFSVIMDTDIIGTKGINSGIFDSGDLQLLLSWGVANDGYIYVYMGSGSGCYYAAYSAGEQRIGISLDFPVLVMYLNGVEVSRDDAIVTANAADATIDLVGTKNYYHLKNLRIYNRALTANEMRIA